MDNNSKRIGPALFFCVNGKLLFHTCSKEEGEPYGDFINYPHSHFKIWGSRYQSRYGVDFDYYPRGRVVYRKTDDTYLIYYDRCMEQHIGAVVAKYPDRKTQLGHDEHYQCHLCNTDYVI